VHGKAELENAGSATWHADGDGKISVSYHWLDPLGNPIVWGGIFSPILRPVPPGGRAELWFAVQAPRPPGHYLLSLDVVADGRSWFSEFGNEPLELEIDVAPRIERRALAVDLRPGPDPLRRRTQEALDAQEEPLVPGEEAEAVAHLVAGCRPAPDWSRRVLDAHAEGFACVGSAIEPSGNIVAKRKAARALAPWAPEGGRKPAFGHPLLCPSVLAGLVPEWSDVGGLPALAAPPEPWVFDARIRVQVPA